MLKINVGLTWVGTIMGEYLVSRAGLGYLIVYGGQVFKLDLVMTSVIILGILAGVMYGAVLLLEKIITKKYILGKGEFARLVGWNELREAINDVLSSESFNINEDKLLGPYFIAKAVLESDDYWVDSEKLEKQIPTYSKLEELQKIVTDLEVKYDDFNDLSYYFNASMF